MCHVTYKLELNSYSKFFTSGWNFDKYLVGRWKVFVAPEVLSPYPIHMYVNKKLLGKTNVTNENTGISREKLEKHGEYINM